MIYCFNFSDRCQIKKNRHTSNLKLRCSRRQIHIVSSLLNCNIDIYIYIYMHDFYISNIHFVRCSRNISLYKVYEYRGACSNQQVAFQLHLSSYLYNFNVSWTYIIAVH